MSGAGKILAVLGSPGTGKATTIGNLVYKCGGIDMPTLERLEKGGNDGYAKAFNEIKAMNKKLCFYTPKNQVVVVTENLTGADGLLLIVTPHQTDQQLQEIGDELGGLVTQFSYEKIVVLVNKLDEVNWSEDAFTDSVRATNVVLQSLRVSEERILFVPASGLHGDNLIEQSSNLEWYSRTKAGDKQGAREAVTACGNGEKWSTPVQPAVSYS